MDLNNFGSNDKYKLGHLKATIAQYFRINGGSTQYRGVIPDVDYLTTPDGDEYGERALKNALALEFNFFDQSSLWTSK